MASLPCPLSASSTPPTTFSAGRSSSFHILLYAFFLCHISRTLHATGFILQTRSQSQTQRTPAIVNIIKNHRNPSEIAKGMRETESMWSVCYEQPLLLLLSQFQPELPHRIYAQFMPHTCVLLLQIVLNRYIDFVTYAGSQAWQIAIINDSPARLPPSIHTPRTIQLQIRQGIKHIFNMQHARINEWQVDATSAACYVYLLSDCRIAYTPRGAQEMWQYDLAIFAQLNFKLSAARCHVRVSIFVHTLPLLSTHSLTPSHSRLPQSFSLSLAYSLSFSFSFFFSLSFFTFRWQ